MNKKICSNEHFKNLLKQFKKISLRVIDDYHDSKYFYLLSEFAYGYDNRITSFDILLDNLLITYKSKQCKMKSGYDDVLFGDFPNKFWVTYTFEDEMGKCSKTPKNIIFRIYIRFGQYRKKRIVKWIVPITWN